MNIAANIIAFLHLLIIIFITVTPFATSNPLVLIYYCYILFFIMLHWFTMNDTCVLTLIESKLRGKRSNDTFIGRLLKPVYNVSSKELHVLAIGLFVYALLKSQIWKKENYSLITNFFYVQWKISKRVIKSTLDHNELEQNMNIISSMM
jgi:hypothetical protein